MLARVIRIIILRQIIPMTGGDDVDREYRAVPDEDAEIIKRSLLSRDADGAAVGSFIFPLIYSFL